MKVRILFPAFLFIAGLLLLIYGFLKGEISAGFFLVFPFFVGSGAFSFVGILLIMISAGLFFFVRFPHYQHKDNYEEMEAPGGQEGKGGEKSERKEFGGVIFIGPIPIVFGSARKMGYVMTIAAAVVAVLTLIFVLLSRK